MTHASDPATYTFTPPPARRDPRKDQEIDTGLARMLELLGLVKEGNGSEVLNYIRFHDSKKS